MVIMPFGEFSLDIEHFSDTHSNSDEFPSSL